MSHALLQRTAQVAALVVLATAGAGAAVLVAVAIIGGVALVGTPAVLGVLAAASWPIVRACLRDALGEAPPTHLGCPGGHGCSPPAC